MHLHPISETHQFSPNLSYLDVLSKNSSPRRPNDEDEEEEEGPPPDPDDPQPAPSSPKKVKKATSNAKEVTVAARRAGDGSEDLGGLSSVRRELILKRRKERDEPWKALDYHDEQVRRCDSISARSNFMRSVIACSSHSRRKRHTRSFFLWKTSDSRVRRRWTLY